MKSVLFTILLQYTIFRRNFQENFFFFFYRKSELKSFSSGLCGASGFRLACSPSHVGVSCRTTPCGSALFAGLPSCNPATPFEKGVDPKTFSADRQHTFNGRVKNPKHRQTVRLRLHEPKKVFGGAKGRFFKNAPWQGVGQRPTKIINLFIRNKAAKSRSETEIRSFRKRT